MRHLLDTLGNWMGIALLAGGFAVVAWYHPIATALIGGASALGLLMITAWFDYDYWKLKFLRWRHADLLAATAYISIRISIISPRRWGKC